MRLREIPRLEIGLAKFDECLKAPADLAEIYIAMGKDALEAHYGVRKTVLLRWISQIDEGLLKRKRAERVRQLRREARKQSRSSTFRRFQIVADARPARASVVRAAADYLRVVRNGGWRISRSKFGDWRVGMMKMSSHQLIEFAVSKGFDHRAALHLAGVTEVSC